MEGGAQKNSLVTKIQSQTLDRHSLWDRGTYHVFKKISYFSFLCHAMSLFISRHKLVHTKYI